MESYSIKPMPESRTLLGYLTLVAMKKHITLMGALVVSTSLFAQTTFSDDFEGYSAGDYIGANNATWTTWSGATGGAEDVQVVTNSANSGSNSVYFSSTAANGGPQDVVLPFGGAHNTGQFTFGSSFRVEAGRGAYFNFQAETTIGTTWSMDCYMLQTGALNLSSSGTPLVSTTYTPDQWFDMRIDVNLNTNDWELFIDNVSQGTFANPTNQVASIDIFPVNQTANGGNGTSGFWVDDVDFTHTPYVLPNRNGAVTYIDAVGGLAGQNKAIPVEVRNLGTTDITSFDLTYDYNGTPFTESVSGVNISSTDVYTYTPTGTIALVAGANPLSVTISNVNGNGSDDDANDDSKTTTVDPIVPAAGKMVFIEEATGTWCGWCPRGDVMLQNMHDNYDGFYAAVAVHNNDPMTNTAYDAGIGPLIGGYPSGLVDRGTEVDPLAFESEFLNKITQTPTALLTNTLSYNAATSELTVTVDADFQAAASGNWRIAVILTEDDVTGTTSQYAQTNYYAGGGNGDMGGYEALADPVPASAMIYNHVGRAIEPSFNGLAGSFPASVNAGETHTNVITIAMDAGWNADNMQAVAVLMNPQGDVDNAGLTSLAGLSIGVEEVENNASINVYPNPTTDMAFVDISLIEADEVQMTLRSITGQIVETRNYGVLHGTTKLPVVTSNLAGGLYLVEMRVGNEVHTSRLIVQ